ncbi:hypothetical protein LCGC14_1175100 [marine sediment metagenome]|uniref:Outer membrane protein beta-barrel domain-containing protein n=1 Tax=marine sediment metagenome TaxID=412755 RepID=A0A0F9MBN1_9ZZZZ|nr:hypothetical protein [Methylophaga sp.]HEC58030.1 hypothetical protein [Methylophaga sp.]
MMKKIFLTIALQCLTLHIAQAAEWSLTSTLNPTSKYDDNVFLSDTNKQDSYQFQIKPTLVGKYALENVEYSVNLGYAIDRYLSLSYLDRENPFINFNTSHQNERSTWGLSAGYVQDSTRNDAELDTGDFRTESTITTRSISPSYSYKLTERDSLSISGGYTEKTYSTDDFSDNESVSLSTGWQHQFSERLSSGFNFSATNYQSEGTALSSDNDIYNLGATLNYQVTELWSLSGQLGMSKLNGEQTTSELKDESTSSGTSYNVTANRMGELDNFSITLFRGLTPSSTGEVNEQDRISVSYSRKLTETISASLNTSYQQTSSALQDGTNERKYLNFSPSIKWQFERNLGLSLGYNYRQQKRSNPSTDATSNAVFVTLLYDWDGLRASR